MPLAPDGMWYPEEIVPEQKDVHLDTSKMPIHVVIRNIDQVSAEEFTRSRREGFGGSDSGVLCGVNPYTTLEELIIQKAQKELTQEELETQNEIAIMKGNDLEPLIIEKATKFLGSKVLKPSDTYEFNDYPYLRMNFDGVIEQIDGYHPVEIKVVTKKGMRHYDPSKAIYSERGTWQRPPMLEASPNNSILTKAAQVGIPPYYYTQVQDEMMACGTNWGFLCALFEATWQCHLFYVPRDPVVQNMIIVNGYKAWERVEALRMTNGYYNESYSKAEDTNVNSNSNQISEDDITAAEEGTSY